MTTMPDRDQPANDSGQPRKNAPQPATPRTEKSSPASPPANTIDAPDALRPGSANDPRNRNKRDPTHISAGTDEVPPKPDSD